MPSARDQLDQFYDRLQTLPGLIGNLGLSVAEAQRRLDQDYIENLAAFTKIIANLPGAPEDAKAVAKAARDAVAGAATEPDKKKAAQKVADAAKTAAGSTVSPAEQSVVDGAARAVDEAATKADSKEAAQFVADAAERALIQMGPAQFLEVFRAIAPSHYQFSETAIEVRADLRVASQSELKFGAEVGIKKGVFSVAVNFSYLKRSGSDEQAAAAIRSVLNAIPADHGLLNALLARGGQPISATFKADAAFKAMAEALGELAELPPAKR